MYYPYDTLSVPHVFIIDIISSEFNVGNTLSRKLVEMNRSGFQAGPKRWSSNKKVVLSVLLGLLITGASLSVFWLVKAHGVKATHYASPPTHHTSFIDQSNIQSLCFVLIL